MAFTQKLINANFSNGENVSGLRISVHVETVGTPGHSTLNMRIYGMTLDHMNQLSTLGMAMQNEVTTTTVSVTAGDQESGMSLVYYGTIYSALSDFQGAVDLPFHVLGNNALGPSTANVKPTSVDVQGGDYAQLAGQFAQEMQYQFENNGVNIKVPSSYFWGSPLSKMESLAFQSGAAWGLEKGILATWPLRGARGGDIPLISAQTGMVGYPSGWSRGIKVKCLYNPSFKIGGKVQVQSVIQRANGTWKVNKLTQDLESLKPNGQWFTTLDLLLPDQ